MTFDSLVDASPGGSLSTHEGLSGHVDAASLTDHPAIGDFVNVDPSLLSTVHGLERDADATSFIMDMDDDVDTDNFNLDFAA